LMPPFAIAKQVTHKFQQLAIPKGIMQRLRNLRGIYFVKNPFRNSIFCIKKTTKSIEGLSSMQHKQIIGHRL